jgi:hypothetical protein
MRIKQFLSDAAHWLVRSALGWKIENCFLAPFTGLSVQRFSPVVDDG